MVFRLTEDVGGGSTGDRAGVDPDPAERFSIALDDRYHPLSGGQTDAAVAENIAGKRCRLFGEIDGFERNALRPPRSHHGHRAVPDVKRRK